MRSTDKAQPSLNTGKRSPSAWNLLGRAEIRALNAIERALMGLAWLCLKSGDGFTGLKERIARRRARRMEALGLSSQPELFGGER